MPTDTPLHKASHNGDLRTGKFVILLANYSVLTLDPNHPPPPLPSHSTVQAIIDEESRIEEKVNAPGASERRPLHRAVGGDHTLVVKVLLEAGANVDAPDKSGRTALHWSSLNGSVESAEILLKAGANPLSTTTSKLTPLHFSAENGKASIVPHLAVAAGDKKINLFQAESSDGKTAAALAKENKHKDVIKALKDAGDPAAAGGGCVIL